MLIVPRADLLQFCRTACGGGGLGAGPGVAGGDETRACSGGGGKLGGSSDGGRLRGGEVVGPEVMPQPLLNVLLQEDCASSTLRGHTLTSHLLQ